MTDKALGEYFASCEKRERAMSREAHNEAAAAAHAEMADRYEALAAIFGGKNLDDVPSDYPKGQASDFPSAEGS